MSQEIAKVHDFALQYPVEVRATRESVCGPLVNIASHIGPLSFSYHGTPEQARKLAAAINRAADVAEGKA